MWLMSDFLHQSSAFLKLDSRLPCDLLSALCPRQYLTLSGCSVRLCWKNECMWRGTLLMKASKYWILLLVQKYWLAPMIYFQILRSFKCVKIRYYNGLNLWNLFINGIDLVTDLAFVLASRKALCENTCVHCPGSWPFTKLTFQMPCSKLDWFATYEVKLCHEWATLFRFACLWCTKEMLHTMKDFI